MDDSLSFDELLEAAANAMPEVCKPYECSEAEIDMLVAEEMESPTGDNHYPA